MLGEDVKNEPRAVNHLDLDDLLELPELTWCQLPVADDRVGSRGHHDVAELARLA